MVLRIDLDDLIRRWPRLAEDVLPAAAASTLTELAKRGAQAVKAKAAQTFDRPRPFTLRGFIARAADSHRHPIESAVLVLPLQARYLRYQIKGEVRREGPGVTGGGIMIPLAARLDQGGNFPQGPKRWLGKRSNNPRIFVAQAGAKRGVFEREGRRRELLAVFTPEQDVEQRLDMHEAVEEIVRRDKDQIFAARFDEELVRRF